MCGACRPVHSATAYEAYARDRASSLQRFLADKAARGGRPLRLRVQLRSFDAVCRLVEQGVGVGGLFGIPKATKNFNLAFEFLQFITSWKINQMTMVEHSKWLAAVKKVKYSGIMEKMRPLPGSGRTNIGFCFGFGTKSWKKIYETLEASIINKTAKPDEYFWKDFISRIPDMHDEIVEMIENEKRNMLNIETIRSASAMGLRQSKLSPADASRMQISSQMNSENLISRYKSARNTMLTDKLLENLKTGDK